jgi:hypothetical protein
VEDVPLSEPAQSLSLLQKQPSGLQTPMARQAYLKQYKSFPSAARHGKLEGHTEPEREAFNAREEYIAISPQGLCLCACLPVDLN